MPKRILTIRSPRGGNAANSCLALSSGRLTSGKVDFLALDRRLIDQLFQ